MTNRQKILFLLLLLFATFLCFYQLGKPELMRWDEQTNYFVTESTLGSTTPWILKLGEILFFEKPPVWYYSLLLIGKLFGTTPFTLRFLSALSGVIITILIFFIGKKIYSPKVGFIAAFFFLTIPQLFFFNPNDIFATHHFRSGDMDALFILLLLLATFSFILSFKNKKQLYWGVGWSSVAIMTKGPLGILPIFIFLGINYFQKEKITCTLKLFAQCLLIFLLITLPWHLFMYLQFGETFVYDYFWYHLLGRATTTLEGHYEPWWFYLKLIITRNFFLLPEVFIIAISTLFFNKKLRQNLTTQFLLVTTIAILIIITLTKTRLAWYLLPVYPFVSLMIAVGVENLPKLKSKSGITRNIPYIMTLLLITIGIIRNLYQLFRL